MAIGEMSGCYEHGKRKTSSNYKRTTYQGSENASKKANISETKKCVGTNGGTSSGYKSNYDTLDARDYDDPDEYASDFAEDYAYDEFGEDDRWEAYEYGYEEAYDHWMEEMGE